MRWRCPGEGVEGGNRLPWVPPLVIFETLSQKPRAPALGYLQNEPNHTQLLVFSEIHHGRKVSICFCVILLYIMDHGQWNEFNSQPATGLHGLRMGDIMYMEMD